MFTIKRVYEPYNEDDGIRVLVDRLWPRGISKEKAKIDYWMKNLAPSNELRKWFGHDPEKFAEFQKAYLKELQNPDLAPEIAKMLELGKKEKITLLYGKKDTMHNQAVVLKKFLEDHLK